MMSMVERVARAIIGPHKEVPRGCAYTLAELRDVRWKQTSANEQREALNQARAAIEAMREPTEAMYHAAYKEQDDSAIHNYGAAPTFDDYWSTAIDAALNEQVAG